MTIPSYPTPSLSNRTVGVFLWLLGALAVAHPMSATSFVRVPDGRLLDGAELVVVARVTARENAPVERPSTDYQIEVERVLKGFTPGSTLVVRVLGGVTPDGFRLQIYGAPHFTAGEQLLLFLVPARDGTYRILHFMLGAFHRVETAEGPVAVRDLSEAHELVLPGHRASTTESRLRDWKQFASWLEEAAARPPGEAAPKADYLVTRSLDPSRPDLPSWATVSEPPARWFEFDDGGGISWTVDATGQSGLAGGGFREFRAGLKAWNDESRTPVDYRWAGTTSTRTGFRFPDGENSMVFDDPGNDIDTDFSCLDGGTLAIGGPWINQAIRGTFNRMTFLRILEGDIVINEGLECFFATSPAPSKAAEELFGHELGHTLGLGHPCGGSAGACHTSAENDALMRGLIHDDGRGARLGSDDIAGLRFLYLAEEEPPVAPSALTVTLGADGASADLSWQDNSSDETGFRIYRGADGASPVLLATVSANTESFTDSGPLAPGSVFSYQVSAVGPGGESSRTSAAQLAVPEPEIELTVMNGTLEAGEVVRFQAAVDGFVTRTEWSFGATGRSFGETPCGPALYCAAYVFDLPGTYTVSVTGITAAGFSSMTSTTVEVGGAPVAMTETGSFVQSVLFAPRGDTGVFESDLWVHNQGSEAATAKVSYLPRGAATTDPEIRRLTVLPGSTLFVPNLVSSLFGIDTGQGSLGILYEAPEGFGVPDLRSISRSFVDLSDPTEGSFGQLVSEDSEASWSAADKAVTGILQGDGFLSTVLAADVDEVSGKVLVDLFDATGVQVGATRQFVLGGRSMRFQTLANLFPESSARPGPFTARFRSTGIRFLASATLLEAGSEDQVFIPAREPQEAEVFFVPRVVRSRGLFDTTLVSQLAVLNNADVTTTVTMELWLRGQNNLDPATAVRQIVPRGLLHVGDVLADLFGLEGDNLAGALRVTWSNSAGVAPRVVSYAFARKQDGSRFGMLVDSRTSGEAATSRSVDFGAAQNALFNASYGVVNLRPAITRVRVTLRDGNANTLAVNELTLKPQQHLERNLAGIFEGLESGENWSTETDVLEGGPVLTYVANINASGDVFFIPGRAVD